MMKVVVDGEPMAADVAPSATLRDALRHVQNDVNPRGRLVIGIRCNGREIPGEEMDDALNRPASAYENIEVLTSTCSKLVTDAMHHAASSLQETEQACAEVADMLNRGQTAEAIESLGKCIRVWQQIHDAVTQSIRMLQLDLESVEVGSQPLSDLVARPRGVLTQIRDALQSQDHVLLADVLQYEFADLTDQWYAVIARIREEAEEQQPDQGRNSNN